VYVSDKFRSLKLVQEILNHRGCVGLLLTILHFDQFFELIIAAIWVFPYDCTDL
jgi:hypothetical protein